jgi:hypothetical protein
VPIDARALLSTNADTVAREQRRIADEVAARVRGSAGGRQVAVALAFASGSDAADADRLTRLGTAGLRSGAFDGAFIKSYPAAASGAPDSTLALQLYLYR